MSSAVTNKKLFVLVNEFSVYIVAYTIMIFMDSLGGF